MKEHLQKHADILMLSIHILVVALLVITVILSLSAHMRISQLNESLNSKYDREVKVRKCADAAIVNAANIQQCEFFDDGTVE